MTVDAAGLGLPGAGPPAARRGKPAVFQGAHELASAAWWRYHVDVPAG